MYLAGLAAVNGWGCAISHSDTFREDSFWLEASDAEWGSGPGGLSPACARGSGYSLPNLDGEGSGELNLDRRTEGGDLARLFFSGTLSCLLSFLSNLPGELSSLEDRLRCLSWLLLLTVLLSVG